MLSSALRLRNLRIGKNIIYQRAISSFSTSTPVNYGFIGLGQMGSRMVDNLLSKTKEHGSKIYIYDAYPQACENAVANGAIMVNSPKEVSQQSSIIITMLRTDEQVIDVYTNEENGILSGIQETENTSLIDTSTISNQSSQSIYNTIQQLLAAKNLPKDAINFMDAPVSGGITAAGLGTLAFLCGGSQQSFMNCRSTLEHMGDPNKIFHCGDAIGSGQITKVYYVSIVFVLNSFLYFIVTHKKACNNLILAISMCGVSEGMNMGIKLGLDPKILAGVINASTGYCWSSQTYNPCPGIIDGIPSSNNYNGGFAVDLMLKDLGLAEKAAHSTNAKIPLGENVKQIYDGISKKGFGDKDFGIIYQYIKGEVLNDSTKTTFGA